jgi:hypothetical protein
VRSKERTSELAKQLLSEIMWRFDGLDPFRMLNLYLRHNDELKFGFYRELVRRFSFDERINEKGLWSGRHFIEEFLPKYKNEMTEMRKDSLSTKLFI